MDEDALSADTRAGAVGELHLTRDGLLTPPGGWDSAITISTSGFNCSLTSPTPILPWLQANPLPLPTTRCQPSPTLQQKPDSA